MNKHLKSFVSYFYLEKKTRFNSKLASYRKIRLLILTNQKKALCIKIKQSLGNPRKSVFLVQM